MRTYPLILTLAIAATTVGAQDLTLDVAVEAAGLARAPLHRLPVRHLRIAHAGLHAELPCEPVHEHLQVLEQSLAKDHARHQINPVSPLGLVEMTRKRTRESLQHILCEDCPTCSGRSYVMTAESVCFEIFREIIRQSRQFEFDEALVLAHQDVIEMLLDEQAPALAELEEQTGKTIRMQPEALYLPDLFDVVLM